MKKTSLSPSIWPLSSPHVRTQKHCAANPLSYVMTLHATRKAAQLKRLKPEAFNWHKSIVCHCCDGIQYIKIWNMFKRFWTNLCSTFQKSLEHNSDPYKLKQISVHMNNGTLWDEQSRLKPSTLFYHTEHYCSVVFLGRLSYQQHVQCVSQWPICSNKFMCWYIQTQGANQTQRGQVFGWVATRPDNILTQGQVFGWVATRPDTVYWHKARCLAG